ncbi:RagB/SusD family nutrient uptake outer membrane protein [Marinoscillum luteum]|uniref:RagB/SusD family nutrient uptake outer membrane protein n=1 Tax=Marinoscillum luteum TaxID=861051 RepID=A0ABW7NDZ2_9BACT
MKRSYILSAFFALGMLFAFSCDDLVEEPVGLLSPEGFFKTPADVQIGLNGGYSAIEHEAFWGRKLFLTLILRGDMVSIGDQTTAARRIEVDKMNMSSNNGMVSEFWPKGYEALAAINYALEGAKSVDAPEEELNAVVAEGRFLRAFIHYHFVRLFGEIPYIDVAFSDPALAYTLPQNPVADTYAGIIADLEFAKEWLPDAPALRSRPGKGTAAGLLASVHLTLENWNDAYDEAKWVIDNSGSFQYALEGEFADLFDPSIGAPSNELLFEIDFSGNDAAGAIGGSNPSTDYLASVTGPRKDERFGMGEGWSVAVPTLAVYDTWDSRDYRKAVSFDTLMTYLGEDTPYTEWGSIPLNVARPHIAKYYRSLGVSGAPSGLNGRDSEIDQPVMRYAEVLLIAAEALNEKNSGPNAEAEGYVNQVRSRARRELDGDPSNDRAFPANIASGMSQADFRTAVLEERRLELAFEGGRWYDIQRRKMAETAFSAGGLEQQAFNPARDYYLPKYQNDVDKNENLTQNLNY